MPTTNEGLAGLAAALRASTNFPLKNSFCLQPEEFEFWRQQTGIEDAEEFEQHALKIQREACEVSDSAIATVGYGASPPLQVLPYGCIRHFSFLQFVETSSITEVMTAMELTVFSLRIICVPGYERLIKLGSEREGAILLDVGCCCEFQVAWQYTLPN